MEPTTGKRKETKMTRLFKTTAIAALAMTTAMPVFAAAHLDVNSMTCSEYNDLSGGDRDKVALMVVADMTNNSDATIADNDGTATATAGAETTAAEESEAGSTATIADSNGTATATSTVGAGDDMARFAEEIKVLNLTCARNGDAMLTEAAAGMAGTK